MAAVMDQMRFMCICAFEHLFSHELVLKSTQLINEKLFLKDVFLHIKLCEIQSVI